MNKNFVAASIALTHSFVPILSRPVRFFLGTDALTVTDHAAIFRNVIWNRRRSRFESCGYAAARASRQRRGF